jgi:hypothetical protein
VIRLSAAVLLAGALVAGPPEAPQALSVQAGAQAALRALWTASVAAREERVGCLASSIDHDTLRIIRVQPLTTGADSVAVSALASLERCGPPEWQGTVHTHIPLREGQTASPIFSGSDRGVMLMWWQRWKADGTFCLLYGEGQAHCEIDGSRLVILPSAKY